MTTPPDDTSRPAPGRRGLGPIPLWVVVLLAWLAVTALAVATDHHTRDLYRGSLGRVHALDLPAHFLTELLELQPAFLIAVLLLLADRRLRWGFVLDFAVVALVQASAASLLKDLLNRMRPDSLQQAGVFLGPEWDGMGNSFPSGHATAAWALAALMVAWYPRWRWVFYVAAALVCWARFHLDRHYLGDLVGGGMLGWFLAQALLAWLDRVRERRRAHHGAGAT